MEGDTVHVMFKTVSLAGVRVDLRAKMKAGR